MYVEVPPPGACVGVAGAEAGVPEPRVQGYERGERIGAAQATPTALKSPVYTK
jgi:hypothetical protein